MNKNFFDKIRYWDFKSIFLSIILIVILGSIGYYVANLRTNNREQRIKSLSGESKAQIVSTESVEVMSQSRKGTRFYIDRYKVIYKYSINGNDFKKTDEIIVSPENGKLLEKILNRKTTDFFKIKYDISDPSKSMISE